MADRHLRWAMHAAVVLVLLALSCFGSRTGHAQDDEQAPSPTLSPYSQRADCIVLHESRWDPSAVNARSGAGGLGQFLASTWATTPYAARSRFDPWAAHAAVCWMLAVGRAREFDVVRMGLC